MEYSPALKQVHDYAERVLVPAVRAGAEGLDRIEPDWAYQIRKPIKMTDPHLCVLGQLTGSTYWTVVDGIMGRIDPTLTENDTETNRTNMHKAAWAYGFDLGDGYPEPVASNENYLFEVLNVLWTAEVQKRVTAI